MTDEDFDYDAYELQRSFAQGEDASADLFPSAYTLSSAFMFQFLPLPRAGRPMPEYVCFNWPKKNVGEVYGAVATWNLAWESGHLRQRWMFDRKGWPKELDWMRSLPDEVDIRLVPRHRKISYESYAPLFHLLPAKTLREHGLPLIREGHWPGLSRFHAEWLTRHLPADFNERFARAFSSHVWPLLRAGGRRDDFSTAEPVSLLSHNLDFWMPYVDRVIQDWMELRPRCEIENAKQAKALKVARKNFPDEAFVDRPLTGGHIWLGEDEAWEVTRRMVETADQAGRLRGLVDAVKSNRVEDDFSPCWSHAKEDFERKIHRKRMKTRVTFVELNDTVPVHGPESEIHEKLLWEDFVAFLDKKERRIVVCLRSGLTRVGEIADELGYANHSPVSKALKRIREKAIRYLEIA